MGKKDRIIAMLTSTYNGCFRFTLDSYLRNWRDLYDNGPQTSRLGTLEITHRAEDRSAEDCLASCHASSWKRATAEVSKRYGQVFGLEPMQYPLYDWAVRNIAPTEWRAEFLGKPIPERR